MCGAYCKRRCTDYRTCVTDLNDLKHRIRTEWTKLDHAVIAAAVHQWRRRLSATIISTFRHHVCSDNCDLSCCRRPVEQLHASRLVWFNSSYDFVRCNAWLLFMFNSQGKVSTLIRRGGVLLCL